MKNEQLYNETVNIILDAYNKKQLQAGHPCGCFIGNIIAYRLGVTEKNDEGLPKFPTHWYEGLISQRKCADRNFAWDFDGLCEFPTITPSMEKGLNQILLTGYTVDEVLLLENKFEIAAMIEKEKSEDWLMDMDVVEMRSNLAGMKAALKLLAEIHETKEDDSIVRLEKIHEKVYAKDCVV